MGFQLYVSNQLPPRPARPRPALGHRPALDRTKLLRSAHLPVGVQPKVGKDLQGSVQLLQLVVRALIFGVQLKVGKDLHDSVQLQQLDDVERLPHELSGRARSGMMYLALSASSMAGGKRMYSNDLMGGGTSSPSTRMCHFLRTASHSSCAKRRSYS
ncbi:hypothetical protein PF005_g13780 [Phytophthora fragariae]|uniref:Uncharacterized protein n=1 Tax=Phytophthora fragariae TaxID=53985 RepID=A0A6A3WHD0_9STRA|nr:hypothetical protein PF003_g29317 [Phytophthora fragariae]KAE8940282.1 hypothetical protein PF009_g9908 [Phytophthora fragariae]KAE8973964.1 hypothetical protein PF011_g25039 [Phytophthora fragariae]KAE9071717.1 hypothetical protein PF010_g25761 [Phytophthora fragariae]KAE9075913.1 hypothetical protein PF007_g24822 [Phytophthora fragariae]